MNGNSDMEETGPMPLSRRSSDHRRQFFRFDPTVSSGTMLQLFTILVAAAVAYGTYREDRAVVKADIDQIKNSAERDRMDVKGAVAQFQKDVGEMKVDIRDMSNKLIKIETQTGTPPSPPSRRP